MIAAAHPGHRSSALINECLDHIEQLHAKLDKRQQARERRMAFTPPTFAEVAAEFERIGMNGESKSLAQSFIAYYESNGWKVGGVKMVNWKATCIGWKKRRLAERGAAQQPKITKTPEPKL